jgi:hypothetical protein
MAIETIPVWPSKLKLRRFKRFFLKYHFRKSGSARLSHLLELGLVLANYSRYHPA